MKPKKPALYDSYPVWMVILINIFMLAVYVAGGYIMFRLAFVTGILYIAFILLIEFNIYREACTCCCYYGKLCAFGRGKIASLFFRKGDPKRFCKKKIGIKDLIPQLLVVIIPVIVGMALLFSRGLDWFILVALLYPVLSWIFVNPIIYGKMACVHCRQGDKCCPALEFFSKGRKV